MRVTVFGLGEAGSLIAADLATTGLDVHGYDPADVGTPPGVIRHDQPGSAANGSELILGITAAADAKTAMSQARKLLAPGMIYADLSTGSPSLMEELAASSCEATFADVALMATVPGHGYSVPSFASGAGAVAYAEFANTHGGSVEVVGEKPGEASARKLLRSVVTKGLAALLIESKQAGEALGSEDWLWSHLVETISAADETLVARLVAGTPVHAARRLEEMKDAVALLESLGVEPTMTQAIVKSLEGADDTCPDQARMASS